MLLRAAAVPPREAREHIAAVVEAVVVPGQGVTPIPAERLHILLAQFGNLPSDMVPRLSSTLAEAMPDLTPAPTLRLAGGGVAEERSYHVVVARVSGEVDELARLSRDAGVVVQTRRLYVDRRRFQPELPVATLDPATPVEAAAGLLSALEQYEGPAWTLAGLSLMRGAWGGAELAGVPVYEEFQTCPFPG
jgi:2'-5' RNA ligase